MLIGPDSLVVLAADWIKAKITAAVAALIRADLQKSCLFYLKAQIVIR